MSRKMLDTDPPYLKAAFSMLGLSEISGPKHEKKVLAMYVASGHPEISDDETAWCAAFVGWCLKQAGLKNTGSLMARSYATYGRELSLKKPIPRGAIMVWTRTGGGHVNFCLKDDGEYVTCIGGNQENGKGGGVTITRRLKAPAVAARMPFGFPIHDKYDRDEPERIQPEDGTQVDPKSMASSKIGNTQIAVGGTATVAAAAQVAKPLLETTSETVSQVSDIATGTGKIIETTKVVTTAVPDSFWMKVITALTSPEFVACTVLVVIASAILTWHWRRQHRRAGV